MTTILTIDSNGYAERIAYNAPEWGTGETPKFDMLGARISTGDLPFRITDQPHRVWDHGIFVEITPEQAAAVHAIVADRTAA